MNPFSAFSTFVLRTPLLPVSFYTTLLKEYDREKLFTTLEEPVIKSALALASPELFRELEKYKDQPTTYNPEKAKHLEQSLLKYIARISSRATPFGLFAGCTTGEFSSETAIQLANKEAFTTHTQFDMQFWTHWLLELGKTTAIREQLVYYPNSSLYTIGNFYRYVEYRFVKKRREHTLAAIRKNPFIDIIYQQAVLGKTITELANAIIEDDSEFEEALTFVNELIDNQFLVSNLEATVTGDSEMERVLAILDKMDIVDAKKSLLKEITVHLKEINLNNHFMLSQKIKEKVRHLEVDFEEKYLLQTDLYLKTNTAKLQYKIKKQLQQVISFLERIQETTTNRNLEGFKKAFLNRYETQEMPLTVVLDTEVGIGYIQEVRMNDSHPILDRLSINKYNKNHSKEESWSRWDYILETKLKNALVEKATIIELKDEDIAILETKNKLLPPTFSAMIEVVQIDNKETLVLESLGNYSAAKLIGRFSNGDAKIHQLANEITTKEATLSEDILFAEIAHIPESRTGNILRRPVLREFEIPYLANSILPNEKQIDIADLWISVVNNTIILKSKKQNQIVVPCLSNAHNYSNNSLPIYHFLADLQGQNLNPVYKMDWGNLPNHYTTFPRVVYKEVILAKAKWHLFEKDIKDLQFTTTFPNWKTNKRIPKYVTIVSGDNTLLLDLEVEICFDILQKTIKTNGKVILEEFLFTNESVVKDGENNNYANQFIVSFFRE